MRKVKRFNEKYKNLELLTMYKYIFQVFIFMKINKQLQSFKQLNFLQQTHWPETAATNELPTTEQ